MTDHSPVTRSLRIAPADLHHPQDARDFLALLDHYAEDPAGGGQALPESTRARLVPQLAGRAGFLCLLARVGETPVGLANAFEGFSTFAARPLLNLHDLVVHAHWRGQGIAHQLLEALAIEARARGCCKLTLEVLAGNQRARRVYHQAGFVPYSLDPAYGEALLLQRHLD